MPAVGRIADYEPQTRQQGLVLPPRDQTNRLSPEDLAGIKERIALDGVYVNEDALWGLNAIASTDAVDSYYTRPNIERALKPYAEDLKSGTSLLGNHDYRTFPYGSSFDGSVVDVKGKDFFVADPECMATKGTLGRYFIVKNVKVNGNETDDLIRLTQYGAIRRTSITFYPQSYECSICARDMMDYDCEHIPGVRYGDAKKVAYGWIMDSRLLETSLVYRNASPDSMLQRKVSEALEQGEVPARFISGLAQRFEIVGPSGRLYAMAPTKGGRAMEQRHNEAGLEPEVAESEVLEPEEVATTEAAVQEPAVVTETPEATKAAAEAAAETAEETVEVTVEEKVPVAAAVTTATESRGDTPEEDLAEVTAIHKGLDRYEKDVTKLVGGKATDLYKSWEPLYDRLEMAVDQALHVAPEADEALETTMVRAGETDAEDLTQADAIHIALDGYSADVTDLLGGQSSDLFKRWWPLYDRLHMAIDHALGVPADPIPASVTAAAEAKTLTSEEIEKAVTGVMAQASKSSIEKYAALVEDRAATLGVKTPASAASDEFQRKAAETLGVERLTIDALREVSARAKLGDKLFTELVDQTVKARVSAGQKFDEAKYREVLTTNRDLSFVQSEFSAHEDARKARWSSGRVIDPEVIPFDEEGDDEKGAGSASSSNVFEHLRGRDKAPQPFAIKRN